MKQYILHAGQGEIHMREILKQKQIDTLYHFTRAENLENIFRYGLVSRDELDNMEIDSFYNDEYRYDNCCNAVCTSIEFPNYKMFYKLRKQNEEIDWAVLELDASILCDFECAYCWTNAGNASIYNVPIENRKGTTAFLELFNNRDGYPQRGDLEIYYPTNPQAEVLVFGTIPTDYIKRVYFKDIEAKNRYSNFISDYTRVRINSELFAPRHDWQAWKKLGD